MHRQYMVVRGVKKWKEGRHLVIQDWIGRLALEPQRRDRPRIEGVRIPNILAVIIHDERRKLVGRRSPTQRLRAEETQRPNAREGRESDGCRRLQPKVGIK